MKRIFKYFTIAGLSGMLCLFLADPASAQRGGHGGGGHGGGGGGGFHGGGGGGRSSGGFSGGGRVSSAPQRSFNSAPQRTTQSTQRTATTNNNRVTVNNNTRSYAANAGRPAVAANGRSYAGGRANVGGYGRTYAGGRAYIGGRYYYGPFAGRMGFYYNRGFYASLYYPRIGFGIGYLPYGYYPFYWDNMQYYYANGYFYNYDNSQYTVVEPPVGAAVNSLPSGAQPITINGQQYYELNGVYYVAITKDDGTIAYQVAGKDGQLDTNNSAPMPQQYDQGQGQYPPQQDNSAPAGTHAVARVGDMIQALPQGSRKVNINGQSLFVTPDDVYLKVTTDQNGQKVYTVVGTPDQE